jgi:hypothetical protein
MKKILLLSIGLVLASVAITSAVMQTTAPAGNPRSTGMGLQYNTMVCVEKNDDGAECSPNELTVWGQNTTVERLFTSGNDVVDHISLSNGTGSAAGIDINSEIVTADCSGLGRTTATTNTAVTSPESDGNRTLAVTFTSACPASIIVNNTGLHNDTVGANDAMFALNNFTDVTLSNADQLTVTWYVWVS